MCKKVQFLWPPKHEVFRQAKRNEVLREKRLAAKKYAKKSSLYDPRNRIVFQGTARLHSKLVWSEISREM